MLLDFFRHEFGHRLLLLTKNWNWIKKIEVVKVASVIHESFRSVFVLIMLIRLKLMRKVRDRDWKTQILREYKVTKQLVMLSLVQLKMLDKVNQSLQKTSFMPLVGGGSVLSKLPDTSQRKNCRLWVKRCRSTKPQEIEGKMISKTSTGSGNSKLSRLHCGFIFSQIQRVK